MAFVLVLQIIATLAFCVTGLALLWMTHKAEQLRSQDGRCTAEEHRPRFHRYAVRSIQRPGRQVRETGERSTRS